MSYTKEQLRGLSYEVAELYGKPHLGAVYVGNKATKYRPTTQQCSVCLLRPAVNCHHVAPRSKGHFFHLVTPKGTWDLRSALFTLCGTGTTGCHGRFHNGDLRARWHWKEPEYADAWWSGDLLAKYGPHNPELYRFGCWAIEVDGHCWFRGDSNAA